MVRSKTPELTGWFSTVGLLYLKMAVFLAVRIILVVVFL
jgi:uncharacterized membrane protein